MINGNPLNADPLNSPPGESYAFVDWAANLDPLTTRTYYALDVVAGATTLRIPISSWQATAQLDRASFLQVVIPAAKDWVGPIAALESPEIVVYKGVRYEDGASDESELMRSPVQTASYQEGPTNATLVLSGYTRRDPPTSALTRALRNVRSVSTAPGYRLRADIDWFLQPGHTVTYRDVSYTAAYLNFYANASDEFMDVGERVL
jgi:hypothetical protein